MNYDRTRIRELLLQLIVFLSSLDGDDRERGRQAAENFEGTLAMLDANFEGGVSNLRYDIGGKGVHDWIWTNDHRRQLEEITEQLYPLLRPD